ncbi:hypothetical protein FF1_003457 [Malus domestica]
MVSLKTQLQFSSTETDLPPKPSRPSSDPPNREEVPLPIFLFTYVASVVAAPSDSSSSSLARPVPHPVDSPRLLHALLFELTSSDSDHRLCSPWLSCVEEVECLEKFSSISSLPFLPQQMRLKASHYTKTPHLQYAMLSIPPQQRGIGFSEHSDGIAFVQWELWNWPRSCSDSKSPSSSSSSNLLCISSCTM